MGIEMSDVICPRCNSTWFRQSPKHERRTGWVQCKGCSHTYNYNEPDKSMSNGNVGIIDCPNCKETIVLGKDCPSCGRKPNETPAEQKERQGKEKSMNKPPQLITADDLDKYPYIRAATAPEMARQISEMVTSKMNLDKCELDLTYPKYVGIERNSTHNILYTTWPIEEEVECDDIWHFLKNYLSTKEMETNILVKECPKCTKKL